MLKSKLEILNTSINTTDLTVIEKSQLIDMKTKYSYNFKSYTFKYFLRKLFFSKNIIN